MSKLVILEHDEIALKLDRIAWQITEEFYQEPFIALVGIRNRGSRVAELIANKLKSICDAEIQLLELQIDKEHALTAEVKWLQDVDIENKAVVLVDDVLNSGHTMSGAFKAILEQHPKSVKVAVLANRDHKAFPIHADFVGVSLATTAKEHIAFVEDKGVMTVYLD